MNDRKDMVEKLLSFARRPQIASIPDRVQALAKLHIIDGVAAMLSGAAAPAARAFQAGLVGDDQRSGGTVIGTPILAAAPIAALANTFSGRLLGYDDVQTTEASAYGLLTHPTVPVLAAVLAIGQARRLSGAAVLSAYLVGVEIATRLAEDLIRPERSVAFPATRVFSGIGAVFAAARLLNLTREKTRASLGLWELAITPKTMGVQDAVTAAIMEAQSIRMAVETTLLVAAGVCAKAEPLDSSCLITVSHSAISSLGEPYSILAPGYAMRIYPCHELAHPAVDLMFSVVNLQDIAIEQIEQIDIGITSVMGKVLSLTQPDNVGELRSNLPFLVALAAIDGTIKPARFYQLPRQRTLHDLMQTVTCHIDPKLDAFGHERARTFLRVTLKNKRIIEMKTEVAKGTPQKPLSEIELFHKFFHCASPVMNEKQAEQVLNRLWLLEEMSNVADLFLQDPLANEHAQPLHPSETQHDHRH
jgi:2-methylcitrate dehydratase PrpD